MWRFLRLFVSWHLRLVEVAEAVQPHHWNLCKMGMAIHH